MSENIRRKRQRSGKLSTFKTDELHPYVARPSVFEPVLTTSQKLTPAQKAHLDEFQDRDSLLVHLASNHGQTFTGLRESQLRHPLDPEVRKRFGIPDSPVVSDETLKLRHLQEHLENIEERVRTAPKRKPLTAEEYKEAGVDVAPSETYSQYMKRRFGVDVE